MRGYKRLVLFLLVAILMLSVSPVLAAAEEGGSPLDALGINNGFLIAQFINFGIIFTLLLVGLWRPVTNMLDRRAAEIQKGLEDASAAASARRNAEAEADKILSQARTEAGQVLSKAREDADGVAKTVEEEARTEAEKIREEARTSAQNERDAQLSDLRSQVANISVAIAERLINEKMDKKTQEKLITDFFSKVPDDAKKLSGAVEVISAMPLTDAEKKKVESGTGGDSYTYTVNPDILGGLILRAGDRVVDGSVRSGLSEISSRLN